jgi:signal transduction histidine kinase
MSARIAADRAGLTLEVQNDGRADAANDYDEGGLGLRVLRDRLEALYRGAATMTAGPTPDGGYRVVLTLPIVEAQE